MQSIKKNQVEKPKTRTKMDIWMRFLKSLESEGGSIFVLVILIGIVAQLHFLGFKDADSHITFVLGALVGLLKGRIEREKEQQ